MSEAPAMTREMRRIARKASQKQGVHRSSLRVHMDHFRVPFACLPNRHPAIGGGEAWITGGKLYWSYADRSRTGIITLSCSALIAQRIRTVGLTVEWTVDGMSENTWFPPEDFTR